MSALLDWNPGDQVLDFCLIVAPGVALLAGVAWVVSRRLSGRPAARHLVLLSALLCCLAMPAMATIGIASGMTLIAIPLLPKEPTGTASVIGPLVPGPARTLTPRHRSSDPPGILMERGRHRFARSDRPRDDPGRSWPGPDATIGRSARQSSRPIATAGQPSSTELGRESRRASDRIRLPSPFRRAAAATLIVWGCGCVLLLLDFVRSCVLMERLRRSARPVKSETLLRLQQDIGRGLGIRRLPRVAVSRRVLSPIAIGFRRPMVLLPDRLIGSVSVEQLRDVLVHEVAHILRRDHLVVLLQAMARALYWPIVPVHGLNRELERAREELCDNVVLRDRDALSYGETLLHLAELSLGARPTGASVGILHWRGELERRIAGLLDPRRSTMTRTSRWVAYLVATLFISGGTIASATRFIAADREEEATTNSARPDTPSGESQESTATSKGSGDSKSDQEQPKPAERSMLIRALGPDGRPMEGVVIHRSDWTKDPKKDRLGNQDFVTDEHGLARVELQDGIRILRLWARAEGYVPLFANWEEEENPDETVPEEFTFRLSRGTVIGGVVRNEDGEPIEGVTVEVRRDRGGVDDTPGQRPHLDTWLAYGDAARTTDAQGRWTLDNVPAGDDLEVRVKLSHPDYIDDPNWGTLQEAQSVTMSTLRDRTATIVMHRGLSAKGTVTDQEGNPVAGAVAVWGDRPYWDEGSQEVRTDEDGVYRFPPLPPGPLTVTVVAPGWMPALRKIDLQPEMEPVDFRLEPGEVLRVRFVDDSGAPIPEVYVGIDRWRGGESLYNTRHPNVLDTQIPRRADGEGLYEWTWAPDDAVTYRISAQGYADHELELAADGSEQTVTLHPLLRISGTVTDAATGRPIDRGVAIPVLEFRPGFLHVVRRDTEPFAGGRYAIELDRTDVAHRVRIEAEGYRSAMSDVFRVGEPNPAVEFSLEPAPPLRGRIVDQGGRPVGDASVHLATESQGLDIYDLDLSGVRQGDSSSSDHARTITDARGEFSFPAQFEDATVIAIHDEGYAEVTLRPDQQPGEMVLEAWARVEGRLFEAGRPVPAASIWFEPLHPRVSGAPRFQGVLTATEKTDEAGRFVFPRVPPVKSRVRADLSVWSEYPISSSQSVPLDLRPGEHVTVDLGGGGASVRGRVVLTGEAAPEIDLHKSLNRLIRKAPGIEPPASIGSLGFDARDGWSNLWVDTSEGMSYLDTLHHYFVTLEPDGSFLVSGVPAGDYELAIRLYEPPEDGCLVNPVGSRVVPFRVSEEDSEKPALDLGEIAIEATPGPRVGEVVPDLAFETLDGEARTLGDLRGRYVLLDFWATWCGPCVENFPAVRRIHDAHGADDRLVVLGLALDEDPDEVRRFVERRDSTWLHGTLRGDPAAEILSRYAISSVPSYLLIGPDGTLLHRSFRVEDIAEVIGRELD